MSVSRPFVVILGVGVLGIGSAGLGARALFTDEATSVQTTTTGSINVQLTSSTAGAVVSNLGKTITFASFGPRTSTFQTPPGLFTMTNIGTIAATGTLLNATISYPTMPASIASRRLMAQMYVCIYSPTSHSVIYDEPVSTLVRMTAQGSGLSDVGTTIAPRGVNDYTTEFYAGTVTTNCTGKKGAATADPRGLLPAAMKGVVTPSLTVSFGE